MTGGNGHVKVKNREQQPIRDAASIPEHLRHPYENFLLIERAVFNLFSFHYEPPELVSFLVCFSAMSCRDLFGVTHSGEFYQGDPPESPSGNWIASARQIGTTGWADFSHLFFHPDGTLYGVVNDKFYKAPPPNSPMGSSAKAWTSRAALIGKGGWDSFKHLFFDPDGVLYGVAENKLYKGLPPSSCQDDWLASATLIGAGGWSDFNFLFFDPKGVMYAVENGNFRKRNPPTDRGDTWLGSSTLISTSRGCHEWSNYSHLFFMEKDGCYGVIGDYMESPPDHWMDISCSMINKGDWSMFKFLMSPMGRK